jgi:diguanylate cyclase (GGDEF)-like protein
MPSSRTPAAPLAFVLAFGSMTAAAPKAASAAPSAVVSESGGDVFDLAHPAVRVFSDRQGLPQNTVHAIDRDSRGYLWVGTQDGAARFNGRAWTVFDMPDREVSNYIRCVVAAPDGSVWFGRDNGGVVRLLDGRLTVFGLDSGLPAGRVNALLRAHDGTIWAATLGGGAARFDGTRFVTVSDGLADARLWALREIEDDSGARQLVAGGEGGIAVLEGSRWRPVDLGPGGSGSANALVQAPGQGPRPVFISTYGSGVLAASGWRGPRVRQVARFGPAEGLTSRLVTSVAITRSAPGPTQLWASTRDAGLFRLEGPRFVRVPLGASITEIYSLRAGGDDDPGVLWVGTRTSGLLRLAAASWVALDRSSGLPTDQVLGLLETRGGDGRPVYWIGTANGLAVIRGDRLRIEGAAQGLPGPQVLALAELRERGRPSEIWASLVGLGLVRRVGERWVRVDARPGFDADYGVWLLATNDEDGAAVLWVGTERNGLARMKRGRWTVLTRKDGLPSDHVVALLETEAAGRRSLWVGMRGGGVAEIVEGRVVAAWNRASGLPNDEVMSLAEVALPGGRREIWAGTRAGVARRGVEKGGAWSRLTSVSGPPMPSQTVLSMGQDRVGRIYLGTQRGVVRLSPQASPARSAEFEAEVFGVADGLPSASVNWGQLRDSRGRIWIATTAGVALFDPARETTVEAPPAPLVLERALVSTTGRAIAPGAALSHQERDVTFEYALLTPRRAGATRYRTQLVGYDAAPAPWTDEHRKSYTNLPAGRYLFRVEAREGTKAAAGPVELAFTLQPTPWLRPSALALEGLAAVSAIVLLLRLREGALRRRAEGLASLVAERTRQLSEANARLAELSVTDALTGLPNRRRLEAHAEEEWRRAARRGEGLAFLMLDVDHFKYYNDALGHLAGDACLAHIGQVLATLLKRPSDLVARYGGEEFACLLSGLDREQALAHAERLRAAVERLDLAHPASSVGPGVTISIGVAWTKPEPAADWRLTLAAADAALYRAKAAGRNRVELSP